VAVAGAGCGVRAGLINPSSGAPCEAEGRWRGAANLPCGGVRAGTAGGVRGGAGAGLIKPPCGWWG